MTWLNTWGRRLSHAVLEADIARGGAVTTLCGIRVVPGGGGLPRPRCQRCEEIARKKRAKFKKAVEEMVQ